MNKQKIFGELIFKLVLLLFGLYYFIDTVTMDISVNAKVYPFIIGLVFVIVMAMLTMQTLRSFINLLKTDRGPLVTITPETKKLISVYLAGILLIALTVTVNFWIAIIVVLPLTAFILEDRKFSLTTFLFLPAGMIILVYIIFIRFLGLRLPTGF